MDLEDRETDDESSVAIDLSHLSVNVSIVNSTFSDCGETTLSVNDTLIERLNELELEDSQGDASYQVDQVSIDFDDSEIVVYIDEDSLSSGDEAIEAWFYQRTLFQRCRKTSQRTMRSSNLTRQLTKIRMQ